MIIEEEYFNEHYRAFKIEFGERRVYSIDYYHKINGCRYSCSYKISLGSYEICYLRLGICEGVVIRILNSNIEELISLRLKTNIKEDPAEGIISRAREICVEEAHKFVESECNAFRENKEGFETS